MRMVRAFLAAAVVVMAIAPAAVLAQGPLEMTTAFPSVVADPGATVNFPVTVITDTAQRVDLRVVSQPEGWSTTLRGGGSTIAAVTTSPNPDLTTEISAKFTAEVELPETVAPGPGQVVIEGRSAAGLTTQLTLDIVTEAQEAGSVALEAEFPNLRGSTTSTFSFNLTLTNDTNSQLTFGLETDAPAGWNVAAQLAGEEQAATAIVDAGSDTTITVTADPPADAAAGENPIIVRAVSGTTVAETALTVEITGSFSMALTTSDGRLNARVAAGTPTTLNLVIQNTGTAPLTNVVLSATPPGRWTVTFAPETIAEIAPNAPPVTVVATITAAGDALAGDYILNIRANSEDATDAIEIRATVETSPIGYLIGIAILVAVAIGLFVVFQRYGRR